MLLLLFRKRRGAKGRRRQKTQNIFANLQAEYTCRKAARSASSRERGCLHPTLLRLPPSPPSPRVCEAAEAAHSSRAAAATAHMSPAVNPWHSPTTSARALCVCEGRGRGGGGRGRGVYLCCFSYLQHTQSFHLSLFVFRPRRNLNTPHGSKKK